MTLPVLHYEKKHGGVLVDLDRLLSTRLLIQGSSGSGKSHAVRQLLEETHGRVQQIVFDVEGEFSSLREKYPYVLAGRGGDVPAHAKSAKLLCRRLLELNASAILDLSDLSIGDRREFARVFLTELMAAPRSLWRRLLVVIDEAHQLFPERSSGESVATEAGILLCSTGRKRGFCAVLATQRLSKLHKDAAAELINKLIGRTGLDVDVKRAGDDLGFDKEARASLKRLTDGEFFAYGPAISNDVQRVKTGPVRTTHPQGTGQLGVAPPPAPASLQQVLSQLGDLPAQVEAEARTLATVEAELREARTQLKARTSLTPAPVLDERLLEKRIAQAVKKSADTITRLRAAIGDLMKFVVQINAENFTTKVGDVVDPDAMKHAIEAAVAQATRLIEANLEKRNRGLEALRKEGSRLVTRLEAALDEETMNVSVSVTHNEPFSVAASNGNPAAVRKPAVRSHGTSNGEGAIALPEGERACLIAVAQHEEGVTREQLSILSGYKRSTRDAYVQRLRNRDFVRLEGTLILATDAGVSALGTDYEPLPTGDALREYWLGRLPAGEKAVLEVLSGAFPAAVDRNAITDVTGYQRSTRDAYIQRLRARKLVNGSTGPVAASPLLFDGGLR